MRLSRMIENYSGLLDPEIEFLTQDSRRVKAGWLFAALPGVRADGRQFIEDAVRNGAAAVLGPPGTVLPLSAKKNVALVIADNPRRALALAAAKFFNRQPDVIAAVTGTNGKTSTVHFAQQLWQGLGEKSASIGTLGVRGSVHGEGMARSGSMTTPDPVSLHAELADLAAAGITHLAMEASSHGLHQCRLDGVRVTAAGFTNLTRDHLDYHKDMDEYYAAKARLFSDVLAPGGVAVLNADIPEFEKLAALAARRGCRVLSYGEKGKYLCLRALKPAPEGLHASLCVDGKDHEFTLPLVGRFQAMNVLCALGLVMAEAVDNKARTEKLIGALPGLKGAPGRLQIVPGHPAGAVYVDYAHTPDALENILKALRPHTRGRLICIAGCGGDRDAGKRPIMGRLAAELADMAIITDDNPRSEDPASIRAQILAGAGGKAREIGNRHEAILWAVREMREGDVLVIAGKGHEQGQILKDRVEPFDDVAEAARAIKGLGKMKLGEKRE